ncbi:hypothetical protein PV327_004276, partial [Microctonus hyperodae]
MSCTDNAKVSDSGYTNTCDNSQSRRSSGSSLSRNSNQSQSSGYCGGHPSTFGSSNEALPQPISKNKVKEHSKKKSKTLTQLSGDTTPQQKGVCQQTKNGPYTVVSINNLDQKFKQSDELGKVELMDATNAGEHNNDPNINTPKEGLGCLINSLDITSPISNKAEFGAIVSLHDGLILHSTASLETALGYSKDAWTGRSFIDYIHPKDQSIFADKLVSNVILPFGDHEYDGNERQTSLFCRLQRCTNVEENRNNNANKCWRKIIKDDENKIYIPFRLNLGFKHYCECDIEEKPRIMFLIITAQPVYSAYKAPSEAILSPIFSTRHTATGHLTNVDNEVVQYFGYLPQDMLGCSIFNYYHPMDFPLIKDIYKTVLQLEGSSFKSKPYRFAVGNGGYVLLKTEWSSFINPWKKTLEFIVGHHSVLRGPDNPDVFQQSYVNQHKYSGNISEDLLKESKIIRNDICTLLTEKIQKSTTANEFNMMKQSNNLATFMESLIYEVKKATISTTKTLMTADDRSFSGLRCPLFQEHDSVMLGEISPHHCCDSESSSEILPSYNQLNYNEKIERFFNSKPLLTTNYGTDEDHGNLNTAINDDIGETSSNYIPYNHNIPNHDSGRSGSNENLSSGSNNPMSSTSHNNDSVNGNSNSLVPENFKLMTLTESLLNKHNQDMEKLMVQKHKELRKSIKNSKLNKEVRINKSSEQEEIINKQNVIQSKMRGHKRSNSQNQENEFFKNKSKSSINVWPQMTVGRSINTTAQNITQSSTISHVLPIYYIPVPPIRANTMTTMASQQNTNQFSIQRSQIQPSSYVPYTAGPLPAGVVYPPVTGAPTISSMIYASPLILKMPAVQNDNTKILKKIHSSPVKVDHNRPESQATSIKAQPGSIMAMSESSKKRSSPCSSLINSPTSIDNTKRLRQIESSMEDSSDSSFYGSFLNTSSGSSWNPEQSSTTKNSE